MTSEQKTFVNMALAGRGFVSSFNVLLRHPEAGELFFALGERVRFHMSAPDKLRELAILLTARYWAAQYEWLAHRQTALQAGLGEDKIKAIAEGRRPAEMSADEETVYTFITELFKTKQVSDTTFAAVKSLVGERGVVELVISAGYYQMVAIFMNLDRLPPNTGEQAELKYLTAPLP
jgi:4-carboxymuconolactone decarboxylase